YLREHLAFLEGLFGRAGTGVVPIGERVVAWMEAVEAAFAGHRGILDRPDAGPEARRSLLDALGEAFSAYRAAAYDGGPGIPMEV
ncbi:MAG: hypothetical protein GWN07_20835, partial [Actinobacteria bacterium]|nr:hypothetical protein [Actinomycetota bacterium]NIS32900.1 hypothetical protein [Actinomycetota bacterium]NIU67863.1 hypothetical protein [Actinomycetota bacterium]NIV88213.1 hypothetical protein [Actinomycetota bacterium]NIW29640.1 hypothetical protein [Actinomycetota bacterium]